ncbi:hypothetical protein V5N11_022046 [Cardamine amara subsp. amara]|uniref:Uncharacterized protein n=1 Tax=Cardamine amara subsp. amara TaxID=228776 RepID=A0ABD1AML5_CARAN
MSSLVKYAAADDDGDDWDTKIDHQYMKLLDSFSEDGHSSLRDNPLMSIRYGVDNGGYDKRQFKAPATDKRRREDRNTIRVTKKNVESKTHVQASELRRRESLVVTDEATLITSHVKRNGEYNGEAIKKENSEDDDMVLDENYRSYLTWLVEKSKSSRTNHGKEVKVKCEEDTMSLSDSDVIVIGDRPFLDEDDSPFVPSKCYRVTDLDDESSDQSNSWFRKEIMNVLKLPYNEEKLKELHKEASVHRQLTRDIELLDGRAFDFKKNETRPSFLDEYPDFKRKYIESLREKNAQKALNLLRGFIFYLTNVVRDDAFKPWLDDECLKIT